MVMRLLIWTGWLILLRSSLTLTNMKRKNRCLVSLTPSLFENASLQGRDLVPFASLSKCADISAWFSILEANTSDVPYPVSGYGAYGEASK